MRIEENSEITLARHPSRNRRPCTARKHSRRVNYRLAGDRSPRFGVNSEIQPHEYAERRFPVRFGGNGSHLVKHDFQQPEPARVAACPDRTLEQESLREVGIFTGKYLPAAASTSPTCSATMTWIITGRGRKTNNVTYRYYMGELGLSSFYLRNFKFKVGIALRVFRLQLPALLQRGRGHERPPRGLFQLLRGGGAGHLRSSLLSHPGQSPCRPPTRCTRTTWPRTTGDRPSPPSRFASARLLSLSDRLKVIPPAYGRVLIGHDPAYSYLNQSRGHGVRTLQRATDAFRGHQPRGGLRERRHRGPLATPPAHGPQTLPLPDRQLCPAGR